MPSGRSVLYRDVFLALLCVGLLTAPLWFAALHIGDSTYRYERVRVTADASGIAYATDDVTESRLPISHEVGCSSGSEIRICSLEQLVLDRGRIPSSFSHSTPNNTLEPGALGARYRYVLLNDTVYEAAYVTNTSAPRDDGMYPVALTLEPVSPERALRDVSVPVESASPVVARAAREGSATSHRNVPVPETPIRLEDGRIRPEDGRYYRVYLEGSDDPSSFTRFMLPFFAFLTGTVFLHHLSRRVELIYVGTSPHTERDENDGEE
ncbi:hypothetical protein ACFR9U_08065 [Halorientalis brevis]|uniref:DUF3592 domain-containing protein n=1 Tax=Halorientalis brevis TaxID=1126241 RepID=A0ABD6C9R0_9EURY|nr:hypothetical protein [Halorientalis brevis]